MNVFFSLPEQSKLTSALWTLNRIAMKLKHSPLLYTMSIKGHNLCIVLRMRVLVPDVTDKFPSASFPLSKQTLISQWHLPPGWENLHHVQQWLSARAQTTRRTSPKGCAASWPTRQWPSRSSEPESARCHSTSSHPPAGSTAPYLW